MKKSVYYRTLYRRDNPIKDFINAMFYDLCSLPRMILEVFVRRELGRRYFSFTTAMIIFFVLFFPPIIRIYLPWNYSRPDLDEFIVENFTWYGFLLTYLVYCFERRNEQKKTSKGSEFDFKHFSLSAGEICSVFTRFKFRNKLVSLRTIETILEPLFFALIGLLLIKFSQEIGWLILFCSICYSISYHAAYWRGEDIMLDIIDERIINEALFLTFVDGDDYTSHDGFRYRGPRPANREFRKNLASDILDEDEDTATAI